MTTAIKHFTRAELEQVGIQIVGERILGRPDQLITEVSDDLNFVLGSSKRIGKSIYRYGLAGAANLALGELCQAPVPPATETGLVPAANYAAGALVVTLTTGAAIGLNEFAGGWMHVNDGTGQGQVMRIISHPATVGIALCPFTLADPVTTDFVAANTLCALTANPYNLPVVTTVPPASQLVGVPVVAIDAGEYGWFQTRGPAAVLTDGGVLIHEQVVPGAVAGSVRPAVFEVTPGGALTGVSGDSALVLSSGADGIVNSAAAPATIAGALGANPPTAGAHDFGDLLTIVGRVMRVLADTEYSLIDLTLE